MTLNKQPTLYCRIPALHYWTDKASIGKQILPKQPELQVKMCCQANQINVDWMKRCQIAYPILRIARPYPAFA